MSAKAYQEIKEQNLSLNTAEAKDGRLTMASLPVSVYADVNLKCNLRCPSCHRSDPSHAGTAWPTMDISTFERVASELFPTAFRVFLSGGGESLLHKDFDRMLELCLDYEVHPVIYTNGMIIDRRRADLLARSGTYLGISIDGASRATFEKLRVPARWRRMVRSLGLIRRARERAGNPAFFPYFQVVLQRDNLGELPAFVDLALEYGIELIKFATIYPHFPEVESRVPSPEEACPALVKVFERANRHRVRLEAPNYDGTDCSSVLEELRGENSFPISLDSSRAGRYVSGGFVKYPDFRSHACGIPWSETMITPEGKVVVGCCSQYQMGDLMEGDFAATWNNERYRELRRTVNSDEPMHFCRPGAECPFRR